MKRYLLFPLIIFFGTIPTHSPLADVPVQYHGQKAGTFDSFPPTLSRAVFLIEQMPEAAALIKEVKQEGPIRVEVQNFSNFDFEALWNSETRRIVLNSKLQRSLGQAICSILFELHNARTNAYLQTLFTKAMRGEIDKNNYVERVERMEHENAVRTCMLIEKGIERGLFPSDSRWNIYEDFDSHYMIQQLYGHSMWLAENFDAMSPNMNRKPYQGTIQGLDAMTAKDKSDLTRYITIKNDLKNSSPLIRERAKEQLDKEIQAIEKAEQQHYAYSGSRSKERKKLLTLIFNDLEL